MTTTLYVFCLAALLATASAAAATGAPGQAETRAGRIAVAAFGAVCDGVADDGPAIANASAYAASVMGTVVFPGGQCDIGAATSFTVDPMTTRWRSDGVTKLRWKAAPTAGVAVRIVSSALAPYESASAMVGATLDGIQITGGPSASTKYAATGLQLGDGVHQTFSFTLQHLSIQGWDTVVDIKDNVWLVTFNKARLLWGAVTTPAVSGNWGENMTFHDTVFADGVTFTMHDGEWKLFGGSLDNSQLVARNHAHVAWFGAHLENPGTTTLARPFIDVQGSEATVQLVAPTIVVNHNDTPITTAPFNVTSANTVNGLLLDGPHYTQGGYAQWYALVSGGGRVRVSKPQILAFANTHFQVIAENARGQLRNLGFEAAPAMAGWTVTPSGASTGTAVAGATRVRSGEKAAELKATSAAAGYADIAIAQTVRIDSGQMLMAKFAYSRNYVSAAATISAEVRWLDAAGARIGSSPIAYATAPAGTDDGAAWSAAAFNGFAPGGTAQAEIVIALQRPRGAGSASLFVDDVLVNVVD